MRKVIRMCDEDIVEDTEDTYKELKEEIKAGGWDIFDKIPLEEGEEVAITSKSGNGLWCKGKGRLYVAFIPDIRGD